MSGRKTKQVVLFIVEGPSDETALGLPFQGVFSSDSVKFDVVHGDLTVMDGRKPMRDRVRDAVLSHLERRVGYRWDDIKMIVEVCDTDGAFVPEDKVELSHDGGLSYGLDAIAAPNPVGICGRNQRKASALRQLSAMGHLTYKKHEVPLFACFLSRNLEHALHGEVGDCSDNRKRELAHRFQRRYGNDAEGFKALLRSSEVAAPGDNKQSWEWIQRGTNSLKRASNLHSILPE